MGLLLGELARGGMRKAALLFTPVQGIREGKTQKLGFLSSAKSLWSIGSMATEARELVGSYISIGTLVNPLSLILGALSLLFVLLLILVSIVLLLLALF
jgi:hypothetical protein